MTIKQRVQENAKQIGTLQESLQRVERESSNRAAQECQTRVTNLLVAVNPEVAKQFDASTQAGKQQWNRLMEAMGAQFVAEQHMGKIVDESTRVKRALASMDITVPAPVAKPPVDPLAKKKEEWNNSALSKPAARSNNAQTPEDAGKQYVAARAKRRTDDDDEASFPD